MNQAGAVFENGSNTQAAQTSSTAEIDHLMNQNAALLSELKSKMKLVEAELIKKTSPVCDATCKSQCDQKAGSLIKELKTTLH